MLRIDCGMDIRPLMGHISACGDLVLIREYEQSCLICLIDVLGHGYDARELALEASEYIDQYHYLEPDAMILGLHEHIYGSRGAVIGVGRLDLNTGIFNCSGIGNIVMKVFGSKYQRIVYADGVVGYGYISPKQQKLNLIPGDTVLMYSDGLRENFDFLEYRSIIDVKADIMAQNMIDRFGTKYDDASCIVLKYLNR